MEPFNMEAWLDMSKKRSRTWDLDVALDELVSWDALQDIDVPSPQPDQQAESSLAGNSSESGTILKTEPASQWSQMPQHVPPNEAGLNSVHVPTPNAAQFPGQLGSCYSVPSHYYAQQQQFFPPQQQQQQQLQPGWCTFPGAAGSSMQGQSVCGNSGGLGYAMSGAETGTFNSASNSINGLPNPYSLPPSSLLDQSNQANNRAAASNLAGMYSTSPPDQSSMASPLNAPVGTALTISPVQLEEEHPKAASSKQAGPNSSVTTAQGPAQGGAKTQQKTRFVWTPELHRRFEAAVNTLGIENAKPQSILQLMDVDGGQAPTRQNIKSHLQKYRMLLQRKGSTPRTQESSTVVVQGAAATAPTSKMNTNPPVSSQPTPPASTTITNSTTTTNNNHADKQSELEQHLQIQEMNLKVQMELQTKLQRQLIIQRQLQHKMEVICQAEREKLMNGGIGGGGPGGNGTMEGSQKAAVSLKSGLRDQLAKHVSMQQQMLQHLDEIIKVDQSISVSHQPELPNPPSSSDLSQHALGPPLLKGNDGFVKNELGFDMASALVTPDAMSFGNDNNGLC